MHATAGPNNHSYQSYGYLPTYGICTRFQNPGTKIKKNCLQMTAEFDECVQLFLSNIVL